MRDMTDQKRQPAGAPARTGGQFAEGSHDEAPSPLREYSFFYPPFPENGEQLIDFYLNHEPTEEHLTKFADAYARSRAEWANGKMASWDITEGKKYPPNHPLRDAKRGEEVARLRALHPEIISNLFARDIARAVQIQRFADEAYTHTLANAQMSGNPEDNTFTREQLDWVREQTLQWANGKYYKIGDTADFYLYGMYGADLS